MRQCIFKKQQQTFPSKASTAARALLERDPGKLFACKIKKETKGFLPELQYEAKIHHYYQNLK